MDIANKIKNLRKNSNLSVYKLAKLSDVSATYIHQIESGEKQPTIVILQKICNVFGITLACFFEEDVSKKEIYYSNFFELISNLTIEQRFLLEKLLKSFINKDNL